MSENIAGRKFREIWLISQEFYFPRMTLNTKK